MSTTVNYYNATGTVIVRTRTYGTRKLADAAMHRARKRGVIGAIAGKRTAQDAPTSHH
jgi:hypothetical protein